ncbi:MAG: hypothetical protein ACPGGB_06440 [Flavobacteriales bacterium]
MSKSVTKTVGPAWAMPSIPRGIRLGVGMGVPLLAAFWVLANRLSGLPGGAWQWEVRPELLLAVVLLAPVNWGLEAFKWAELMPYSPMVKRFREVLYGTAWSLIGPLRMGAVVGRVGAVRKAHRNHALRAFATGSAAQWWCTITGAGIALALMGIALPALAVLVLSAVTLGLYFGWSPGFWAFIRNTPISGDWGHARRIPAIRRRRALSLSVARYTVMLTQFVLALQAFHHMAAGPWVDQTVQQTAGSAMTWGLTSLAPVPLLGDLGLREASALLVLPTPTPQDVTAIVGATLSLWIINLILPALVGLGWQWNVTRIRARRANLPS